MTNHAAIQELRDSMEATLRSSKIGDFGFDCSCGSGAWSWDHKDLTVYATPWWEGAEGIAVQVTIYIEGREIRLPTQVISLGSTIDDRPPSNIGYGFTRRAVRCARAYLAAMTEYLNSIEVY